MNSIIRVATSDGNSVLRVVISSDVGMNILRARLITMVISEVVRRSSFEGARILTFGEGDVVSEIWIPYNKFHLFMRVFANDYGNLFSLYVAENSHNDVWHVGMSPYSVRLDPYTLTAKVSELLAYNLAKRL